MRLLARVVIAERGVELHAGVEQRLVRDLELVREVLRPLRAVDVVADGDDELEREALMHPRHFRRQFRTCPRGHYRSRQARANFSESGLFGSGVSAAAGVVGWLVG